MDRFIVGFLLISLQILPTLKSNMDRFIAKEAKKLGGFFADFKIQYG